MSEPQADMSPRAVAELREEGEAVLVDVREPYEHDAGRIAGALHVQLAELAGRADELPRDRPVVFYCRVGSRSSMATDAFRANGYDARNLAGGLVAWTEAGLPLEPADGRVAEH